MRRISDDQPVRRDIAGDDRAHADHRKLPERDAGPDGGVGADGRSSRDSGGLRFVGGIRRLHPGQTAVARTGKAVVGENDVRRDHAKIFDGDRGTDVHRSVQLDEASDGDVVRDVGLLTDDRGATNGHPSSKVYVVPDLRAVAEGHPVFDERSGVNEDAHDASDTVTQLFCRVDT